MTIMTLTSVVLIALKHTKQSAEQEMSGDSLKVCQLFHAGGREGNEGRLIAN